MHRELAIPKDAFPSGDGIDWDALLRRAANGDREAINAIAPHLDQHPTAWKKIGDLGRRARLAWVEAASGQNNVVARGIDLQLKAMREELTGDNATPLERLLVERVLVSWLQACHADEQYAALLGEEHSADRGTYHQRRIDRAHHRFLSACRSLAVVRRLLGPSIVVGRVDQLNVAERAVNVAATAQRHNSNIE